MTETLDIPDEYRTPTRTSQHRFSLGALVLRRAPIVLILLLLGAAAGFAYGSTRPLTYTAAAQLVAGPVVSSPQTLAGDVDASADLAASYARLGATQQMQRAIATELGVPVASVTQSVSVSAAGGNPTIRIEARGPSQARAVEYAAATATVLERRVDEEIAPERVGRPQLEDYRQATEDLNEAQARLRDLRARRANNPQRVKRSDIDEAVADVDSAELRQQVAAQIYTSGRQNAQQVVGLSTFDEARVVSDNRNDQRLRWTVAGGAAGLVLGLLVATLAALSYRRRLRRI